MIQFEVNFEMKLGSCIAHSLFMSIFNLLTILTILLSTTLTLAGPTCASTLVLERPLEAFHPSPGLLFRGVVYRGDPHPQLRQMDLGSGYEQNSRFTAPEGFFQSKVFLVDYTFGLKTVHKAYGKRLAQIEKDLVQSNDLGENAYIKDLESHHVSFALAFGDGKNIFLPNAEHAGFLKLVESNNSISTPAEKLLKDKGIHSNFFNKKRGQGYKLIEIGKFTIHKNLNLSQRLSVKRELLRWLYDYFLKPGVYESDKVLFIIDVSNPSHKLLYEQEYGATPLDSNLFVPNLKNPDNILTVSLSTLRKKIREQLGNSISP